MGQGRSMVMRRINGAFNGGLARAWCEIMLVAHRSKMAIFLAVSVGAMAACGGDAASQSDDGADAGVLGADAANAIETGSDEAAPGEAGVVVPATGWRGDYFDDFATLAFTRFDQTLGFDWSATSPDPRLRKQSYSVRWSGALSARFAETYTFTTSSDDGVRLWVDGKLLIDDWTGHAPTDDAATITLAPGKTYDLRLEYFQYLSGAELKFFWSSPSQPKELVPALQVRPASTAPTADGGAPLPAPRPNYTNAVVKHDCPDPGVMKVDGAPPAYYMVCTGGTFPIRTSSDLVTWTDTGSSLLPTGKAPWAGNGNRNWAPEIHRLGTTFVAYFTASDGSGKLAIGAAHATSPVGPWTLGANPIVSQTLGVIDAHFFADDDGTPYLYWKVDGNAVGQPTPIYAQKLAANGLSFAPGTTPTMVLTNEPATWEGGVVEAPWVIHRGAHYFLFYSGNVYDERYRTGVARSASPLGPFTKHGAPILQNNLTFVGPGHGSVVVGHAGDYFFHHAWTTNGSGVRNDAAGRWGLVEPIVYVADWPVIGDGTPSAGPLAWP